MQQTMAVHDDVMMTSSPAHLTRLRALPLSLVSLVKLDDPIPIPPDSGPIPIPLEPSSEVALASELERVAMETVRLSIPLSWQPASGSGCR